jgi:glucokinase
VLVLDVGGTSVDGAVVTADGRVVGGIRRFPSLEDNDAATVIGRLAALLSELRRSAGHAGVDATAVGVGIPGPFDYERGVSWMSHKLAALRGLDLEGPLRRATGLPVRFCNDAAAFTLGAWWRQHPTAPRLVGITIGTGLGSGFVVGGRPAGDQEGAPVGGEVWNAPFRDGILEDAVSGRAVSRVYRQRSGGRRIGAGAIAERARHGDVAAVAAFSELGDALGEGLAAAAAGFSPTRVVVGGRVADAFDLFGPRAETVFARAAGTRTPFDAAARPDLALIGIARHVAATGSGAARSAPGSPRLRSGPTAGTSDAARSGHGDTPPKGGKRT